ncbi:GNAT family N-acetyltransferase [Rothia sp. LK2588]|uniref:GNAT family N-acetyltransferase n=1 Tax=Rothia sp. LK2588 TaxID=3114369 RepID=UPI0034CFAC8F
MQPEIITDSLTLRPLAERDVPALTHAWSDPEIRRWCMAVPLTFAPGDVREFVAMAHILAEAETEFIWAIEEHRQLRGMVSLFDITEGNAQVGFWLAPNARGHGVLTRALHALTQAAFADEDLALDRLTWTSIEGNIDSRRAAVRAGFAEIRFVPGGTAGRPDSAGRPTRLDAWQGVLTRSRWEHFAENFGATRRRTPRAA